MNEIATTLPRRIARRGRGRTLISWSLWGLLCSGVGADPVDTSWPGDTSWPKTTAADVELDRAQLERARAYALTGGGAGYITRHGKLIISWGDARKRYDLKSTSKSIGVTAVGLALADGKFSLKDQARRYHPTLGTPPESNAETGWLSEITMLHLATQTAGFEKHGGYRRIIFRPGTKWHYSDGGPNWLAECITLIYRRDVQELLRERVFSRIGISAEDLHWRENAYRPHEIDGLKRREFGSGVHANVDAMARIGYLYLRRGKWRGEQLIPRRFVDLVRAVVPDHAALPEHPKEGARAGRAVPTSFGNASAHYGLLWWNNADGALEKVPKDCYWSWGLHDSLIVVVPSLDIVAARAGSSWPRSPDSEHYDVLVPFLEPICTAATE